MQSTPLHFVGRTRCLGLAHVVLALECETVHRRDSEATGTVVAPLFQDFSGTIVTGRVLQAVRLYRVRLSVVQVDLDFGDSGVEVLRRFLLFVCWPLPIAGVLVRVDRQVYLVMEHHEVTDRHSRIVRCDTVARRQDVPSFALTSSDA